MNVPLNIDWQQILLHLLNFVVLFAVLYFLLYDPVKKFMNKRVEYYKNLDDEAKANLSKSEKAKEEYLKKISEAEGDALSIKEQARKSAEDAHINKIKQAESEAEKILADARQNAERERTKILKEAQEEIMEMVTSATKKLIVNSSSSDAFDSFLDAAKRSENNE